MILIPQSHVCNSALLLNDQLCAHWGNSNWHQTEQSTVNVEENSEEDLGQPTLGLINWLCLCGFGIFLQKFNWDLKFKLDYTIKYIDIKFHDI